MIIEDALPRVVDLHRSLGLDALDIAVESAKALLDLHPELRDSALKTADLEADGARHLEYLGLSITQQNPQIFVDYLGWAFRLLAARGLAGSYVRDHLVLLKGLLGPRLPGDLAARAEATIDEALEHAGQPRRNDPAYPRDETMETTGSALLASLLRGNREEALAVLDEGFRQGLKLLDTYLGVIQPVLYEIGRRWEENEITVAQEHIATGLMHSVLAYCHRHFHRGSTRKKGRIALTGVPGELHELGLRIVGDVLEAYRWDVTYLGTNCPSGIVVGTLAEDPPDVIGISVTMDFNLPAGEDLVRRIRDEAALGQCKVFVGGAAALRNEQGWRSLGAICGPRHAGAFLRVLDTIFDREAPGNPS